MTFLERLKGRGRVIFDGGMGTMIQKHMRLGQLPEELNLTMPEVIADVHRAYLAAGCDVVETNTLNANQRKLNRANLKTEEVIAAAVGCARKAIAECGRDAYAALSMGSTGVMLEPLGDMTFDEAEALYAQMAAAGEKAGADLILIETVSDLHEIKAAILGAKRATKLPVGVTMTFEENGRTLTGADIPSSVATLEALGVDFLGMNCGLGPVQMRALLPQLLACAQVPVLVNPNAGLPKVVDGKNVYSVQPEEFAAITAELAQAGVNMVGGCCGTTPDHIRALAQNVAGLSDVPPREGGATLITSGSKKAALDGELEIEDISADDPDDLMDNAMDAEGGALLVSGSNLAEQVTALQECILTPMYLKAETPGEARKALRYYNGKPLIGVADRATVAEYAELAACGADLTVADAECARIAAEKIGEKRVLIDAGDGFLRRMDGTVAAKLI